MSNANAYIGAEGTPSALGNMSVGSIVKLKENETPINYLIVHQGKPSSIYDDSCDGTWLLRQDIAENRAWDSENVNRPETSDIHIYLNNTWLNRYDANIKSAIKQVRIPYRQNGGYGGTDCTGANGLLCKIFLLSAYEVGWTAMDNPNFPATGAKLSYFLEGMSSSANNKRIATLNGAPSFWWLRTPLINDTKYAALVGSDGDWYSGSLRNNNGIRPAFVLPSDLTVLYDGTVTTDPPQGPPVAHKVKNIYVGVDNLACKVTKGYIGVGDVARCFLRLEPETTGYPFGLFSVSPLQYDFTEIIQWIGNYDNIPLDMDSFVDQSPETDIAWSEYEFWQDTYGNLMREETDENWPEDFSDLIGTGVILWNLTFDPTKVKDTDGMPADFIDPDTGEAKFLIYCDANKMDQYDWASVRGVVYDVYQQAWKIFNPIQNVNFNVGYIGISVPVQFPE